MADPNFPIGKVTHINYIPLSYDRVLEKNSFNTVSKLN